METEKASDEFRNADENKAEKRSSLNEFSLTWEDVRKNPNMYGYILYTDEVGDHVLINKKGNGIVFYADIPHGPVGKHTNEHNTDKVWSKFDQVSDWYVFKIDISYTPDGRPYSSQGLYGKEVDREEVAKRFESACREPTNKLD